MITGRRGFSLAAVAYSVELDRRPLPGGLHGLDAATVSIPTDLFGDVNADTAIALPRVYVTISPLP